MTTYKEYINPEVEFKVRQRGKKNKKQSIKGGPVTEDMIKYRKRESSTTSQESIISQPRQTSLSKRQGLGAALRGGGRAFYKGGKV